jgi:hypothetical protein
MAALGDGVYAMKISNVPKGAKITCKASNDGGAAESACTLTVEEALIAPKFTEPLRDTTVSLGDPLVTKVAFIGQPSPTLTWFVNRKQIDNDTPGISIKRDGNTCTLTIAAASMEHLGEITCTGENPAGSCDTHCQVNVVPKTKAPVFTAKPHNDTILEGESMEFEAEADGEPVPTLKWYRNGKELMGTEPGIKISSSKPGQSILKITNASPGEHAGEIMCKATSKAGTAEAKAKLGVTEKTEPPKFLIELADLVLDEKESAKFTVQVSGQPTPTLKWLLNGKAIASGADGITIEQKADGKYVLTIAAAKPEQTGRLECVAENVAGKATSAAQLGVTKKKLSTKPMFMSPLAPINLTEGDTLRTKVLITGDPEPQVKWTINNELVVKTEDVTMTQEDGVYILEIQVCQCVY